MKKVLIYGGTGGIGTAIVRKLDAKGIDMHLAARNGEHLKVIASEVGCGYTVGDVNDPEFFSRVSAEAGEALSGLVYAVGTINLRSFQRLEPEDYLNDFKVNVLGAAMAVKHALPALKKAGDSASVVFFSSVAASNGFPMHASIGTAKAAVNGLVRSLAAELAPGIRVNAIAPSLVDTPLAATLLANVHMEEKLAAMHPMQRLGKADEVAALAEHLLSKDATWITGQVFAIDGGRSTIAQTK